MEIIWPLMSVAIWFFGTMYFFMMEPHVDEFGYFILLIVAGLLSPISIFLIAGWLFAKFLKRRW